jgi:hypothetical protein
VEVAGSIWGREGKAAAAMVGSGVARNFSLGSQHPQAAAWF